MVRDMLSDDELNALLKEGLVDVSLEDASLAEIFSSNEQDNINQFTEAFLTASSNQLTAELKQKVTVDRHAISLARGSQLAELIPQPSAVLYLTFEETLQGFGLLMLKESDLSVLTGLVLNRNGMEATEELNEQTIKVVHEMINAAIFAASRTVSNHYQQIMKITVPSLNLFDLRDETKNQLSDEEVFVQIRSNIRVGSMIDSEIVLLLPVPFVKEVVQLKDKEEKESTHKERGTEQRIAQDDQSEQIEAKDSPSSPIKPVQFSNLDTSKLEHIDSPETKNLDLLLDIPLQVTVELGRTKKIIKDILEISSGSIVVLDKLAGEPVDILVNNKLIAKGEVVVIDENFGVRITDILSPRDRLQKLK